MSIIVLLTGAGEQGSGVVDVDTPERVTRVKGLVVISEVESSTVSNGSAVNVGLRDLKKNK